MRSLKAIGVVLLVGSTLAILALPARAASSWGIVPSPNAPPAGNFLSSINCISSTNCWATGYYYNGTFDQTLIERYNGTSWTVVTSPNTGTSNSALNAVTCTSSSNCWAAGYYNNGTVDQNLTEHYDGTAWSIVSSLNTGDSDHLNAVTCTSSNNCWFAGYYQFGTVHKTLFENYDGTFWSIPNSPNTGASDNFLSAVACTSSSNCWAAGYYNNGTVDQTLIERYDGNSWTIVSSPNTSTSQHNLLNAVTCTSGGNCWAAGRYVNSTADQTLIERYNGTSWSIVSSPNTSASKLNLLNAVTCVSSTDCRAAGTYSNGTADQTLIESYNGTSWSIVNSPNTIGSSPNLLYAVTCVSSTSCWAAGTYYNGNIGQTLIESGP
jgi:hypothetical protein